MPVFSVLIALYNVEPYVEATLLSLQNQTIGIDQLEIIVVDDGSTDRSFQIVENWAKSHPNVKLYQQENQGAGAARKLALANASSDWVTVVDPDDILDKKYFEVARDFLERDIERKADMLVSNIMILNDATGKFSDTHPLNYRFKHGTRLVRLVDEPTCIQLGATAFLKTEILRQNGLTYDTRIEPTFEDAHLLGRYLATSNDPVVGVMPGARYYYRKRFDNSSLVQSSWALESRYTTVLELGYLSLLEEVKSAKGSIPVWAQNMVLYDLIWYFKEESQQHSRTSWLSDDLQEIFINKLKRIFDLIDTSVIEEFAINNPWWSMRETILTYFKRSKSIDSVLYRWGPHSMKAPGHFCILYSDYEPEVQAFVNGLPYKIEKNNYTNHRYFGKTMMVERNFEIGGDGHIRLEVNGIKAEIMRPNTNIKLKGPSPAKYHLVTGASRSASVVAPKLIWSATIDERVNKINRALVRTKSQVQYIKRRFEIEKMTTSQSSIDVLTGYAQKLYNKNVRRRTLRSEKEQAEAQKTIAAHPEYAMKYKNAWVLIDRPLRADDNAEHLYRYVFNHRPDINAYFLLSKASKDWNRLEQEGFKLVEYGSQESIYLLLNCVVRASSDAVADVMYPISRQYYNLDNSKFVFLQHGVTMNDLSRWLNPKKIDALICATYDEYDWFVGKNSPYTIKKDRVFLTGFPRYDGLQKRSSANSNKNRLMIMPTWRQYLRDELDGAKNHQERVEIFRTSNFGRSWLALLNSPALREFAEERNLEISFVPHPAIEAFISDMNIPEHVHLLDPAIHGFQNILAASAYLITDYSSIAFDAANIGVEIVYYQFDRLEMFGGRHNVRPGYFEFERHGFGPVTANIEELENHFNGLRGTKSGPVVNLLESRVSETFKYLDNSNSKRVVSAIETLI